MACKMRKIARKMEMISRINGLGGNLAFLHILQGGSGVRSAAHDWSNPAQMLRGHRSEAGCPSALVVFGLRQNGGG
jgi:hypothetical protein